MLLQLHLVLPGQLLVLPLELGDEDLPLDLLLLLQGQQLLLQLLLAHAPARLARGPHQTRPGRLLTGRRERGHLLLLLLVVLLVVLPVVVMAQWCAANQEQTRHDNLQTTFHRSGPKWLGGQ